MWAGIFVMIMAGALAVTGFTFRPAPDSISVAVGQVRTPNMKVDPVGLRTRGMAGYVAYYHGLAVNYVVEKRKTQSAQVANDDCKPGKGSQTSPDPSAYKRKCYKDTIPVGQTAANISSTTLQGYMNAGYKANLTADKFRLRNDSNITDDTVNRKLYIKTSVTFLSSDAGQRLTQMRSYITPMIRMVGQNYLGSSTDAPEVKLEGGLLTVTSTIPYNAD